MSDEQRTPEFIWLAVVVVPICSVIGGYLGNEEAGLIGGVVGVLAGGFAGFVGSYLFMVLLGIGMILIIFLGPIALIAAAAYWLLNYGLKMEG